MKEAFKSVQALLEADNVTITNVVDGAFMSPFGVFILDAENVPGYSPSVVVGSSETAWVANTFYKHCIASGFEKVNPLHGCYPQDGSHTNFVTDPERVHKLFLAYEREKAIQIASMILSERPSTPIKKEPSIVDLSGNAIKQTETPKIIL